MIVFHEIIFRQELRHLSLELESLRTGPREVCMNIINCNIL